MAATKRFMNWTGVTFTPSGGSAIAFTGVTNVQIGSGGSLAKFAGDGDRYNTTIVNDMNEPTATVQCADLAAVRQCQTGMVGVLVATHNDAKNLAGEGAITYTFACVVNNTSVSGAHRQYGQGSVSFDGLSTDGITNPLATAVAPPAGS